MSVQIYPISFGFVQTFLLKGEKTMLVDAGMAGQMARFRKGLMATNTQIDEIDLLLLTHGHFDHIGLVKEIADFGHAKTAIHAREKGWVESGKPPMPPGATTWGKIMIALSKFLPKISVPGSRVDIALSDEGLSLKEFGIPGQVVYTPGHTMGSTSVLLDSGEAFVGDLAMSAKIMRLSPGIPIFAEDLSWVKPSWQKLLDLGAKTIYPAHGKPFSADVFQKQL